MYRQNIQFPPKDEALREDVHALGTLFGEMLREQGGQDLFGLVEGDRLAAIQRREGGSGSGPGGGAEEAGSLERRTRGRTAASAADLTRAFATWFQAVNTAERVHRVRRRREYQQNSRAPQPGGIADCIGRLRADGVTLEQVLALIDSMSIEPVFTAHPTESTRRTLLRKQQQIAQLLLDRLNPALNFQELETLWARIRLEITTIWQTAEHPRQGLTVADEREHVLFYLGEILYRVVPTFYEEIETALAHAYSVPVETIEVPSILRFGSWVGGDMDGKPDVHAKTLRDTLQRHHRVIVSAYFRDCRQLAETLSQSASRVGVTTALAQRIEVYEELLPGTQALAPARHDRMPYRIFFGQIAERLNATFEGAPSAYQNAEELLADVELAAQSLNANRGRNAGYFLVRRLLRRIRTFGFHVATLDVIQHASVHHQVIASGLGRADWPSLPASERLANLRDLLARDQGPLVPLDPLGRRTLWVFEAIVTARHKFGERAIGDYVVSGVRGPEDVLAVLLLARWADMVDKRSGESPLDVVPLLETLEALQGAGELLRALAAEPAYRRHLAARADRQTVLLGFSESDKQGGIAASRWAVQSAQMSLLEQGREAGVIVTPAYARGGTASRGGGRTENLVEAAPSGSIRGVLRLTEQGEVVNQSYGLRPLAMRTLERTFAAVALTTADAHAGRHSTVAPQRLAAMRTVAERSLAVYRELVYGEPGFHDYFRAVTPVDVIERMHIGSRAAARPGATGLDALRPIPWVFAWSQSRHMLPGWYGVGSGLAAAAATHGPQALADMLAGWPFFRHLVDDVEAMLARTDLGIASLYDELADADFAALRAAIAREHELAVRQVLELRGATRLLDRDPTLQRSITLRNPYVDPMHLMQVDLLRRWRAAQRADEDTFAALCATISGIAQGLEATG